MQKSSHQSHNHQHHGTYYPQEQTQGQLSKQKQLEDQNFSNINWLMFLSTLESLQNHLLKTKGKRFGEYDFVDYSHKTLDQLKDQAQTQLISIEMSKLLFNKTHGPNSYKLPNSFNQQRLKTELQRFYNIFQHFQDVELCEMVDEFGKLMLYTQKGFIVKDRNFGSSSDNEWTGEKKKSIVTQGQHAGRVMQDKLKEFQRSGVTRAEDIRIYIKEAPEFDPSILSKGSNLENSRQTNFRNSQSEQRKVEFSYLYNSQRQRVGFLTETGEAQLYKNCYFGNDPTVYTEQKNRIGYMNNRGEFISYQNEQPPKNQDLMNFDQKQIAKSSSMEIEEQKPTDLQRDSDAFNHGRQQNGNKWNQQNMGSNPYNILQGDQIVFNYPQQHNTNQRHDEKIFKNSEMRPHNKDGNRKEGNSQFYEANHNIKKVKGVYRFEKGSYRHSDTLRSNEELGGIYNQEKEKIGEFYYDKNGKEERIYYRSRV